jgi:hypothetical protein
VVAVGIGLENRSDRCVQDGIQKDDVLFVFKGAQDDMRSNL